MAINLTDALNAATTKGKLADAKQIYLEGDNKNLQDAHKDNEDRLNTLDTRSTQIEESLKTIAATGGASNANAVIYDNNVSGLTAINVKGALDELASKKFDKESIVQKSGDSEELVMSQKAVSDKFGDLPEKVSEIEEINLLGLNDANLEAKPYTIKIAATPNETYYLYLKCVNGTAKCIRALDINNSELAFTTQNYTTGGYFIRELTTPENTAFVEFNFSANKEGQETWNYYNTPRAWIGINEVAKNYYNNRVILKDTANYINDNKDIELSRHSSDSANIVTFRSDYFNIEEGWEIQVSTVAQASLDVIQFFNDNGDLLEKVTCGGSGGYKIYTKIAPKGSKKLKIAYQYKQGKDGVALIKNFKFSEIPYENYKHIAHIVSSLKETPTLINDSISEKITEVFTIETESVNYVQSTTVYPCIENTKVTVRSFHQIKVANISFCSDLFGKTIIGEPIMGDGSGAYKEKSGTAPAGTRSVKIIANYKQTKPLVITKVNPLAIAVSCNNKIYEIEKEKEGTVNCISIDGDSTSQGLKSGFDKLMAVNPQMGTISGIQVGGESTLDTVTRVGCVPLVVMPFSLPAGQTEIEVKAISQKLYKPYFNVETGLVDTDYKWAKFKYKTGGSESYVPYGIHNFYLNIKGFLNGVFCTLDFDRGGDRVFKLKINKPFEQDWGITTPTPLFPDNEELRHLPTIVLMGTNNAHCLYNRQNDIYGVAGTIEWDGNVTKLVNSHTCAENLVDLYRNIRDYSYCPQKFIAVGYFCPQGLTKEFYEYFESLMLNEFGNNFFNARQYLMESGWKDAGYTLNSADIERINNGMVPLCCFGGTGNEGNPHLTTNANIALAYRVAQRCRELGIYDFDPVMPEL